MSKTSELEASGTGVDYPYLIFRGMDVLWSGARALVQQCAGVWVNGHRIRPVNQGTTRAIFACPI